MVFSALSLPSRVVRGLFRGQRPVTDGGNRGDEAAAVFPAGLRPEVLKIAVVGSPGVGKGALVQSTVQRYGGSPVQAVGLSGAHAVVGSLVWPGEHPVSVSLHTLYGNPDFSVLQRLILEGCHGLVFVADAHFDRVTSVPATLRNFFRDASRVGIDFGTTPVAVQYHRTDCCPGFDPVVMDDFLQISPKQVARFATSIENCENSSLAIEWVIRAALLKLIPNAPALAG